MSDDDAYMALVTSNSQGELSPLEIGMHALHCVALSKGGRVKGGDGNKGGLSEYAGKIGRDESFIRQIRKAAEVAEKVGVNSELSSKTQHLSAIHSLPEPCWQPAMLRAKKTPRHMTERRVREYPPGYAAVRSPYARSEEHTSELQSQ